MLDDLAVLHDGYSAGDLRNDGEIVGDEEDGEIVGAAKIVEEGDDLGLHGDVESGGWLVCDEEAGTVDDGHGDEDALALASGELVGIVVVAVFRIGDGDLMHGF